MTPMLRLKLEHFRLAREEDKPESYNKEFDRTEVLSVTLDMGNMRHLVTILSDFLDANQPQILMRGQERP